MSSDSSYYHIKNVKGGDKMKLKRLLPIILIIILLGTACGKDEEIMRAADWADKHPDVFASYMENVEMESTTYGGSVPVDYLEQYPYLKTFYDGYGFSKEYARARGHVYGVEDVINTSRPKPGASCLACKTADFTEALNKDGIEVNAIDFDEFVANHGEMEGISCFDCHRNEPGTINITREHFNVGLEHVDASGVKAGDTACGQCHVEYYLDPETKEVILPWHNGLGTDGMLDYYDDIEFADWVHPTTGTQMLKAQHPEFETFQGGIHHTAGLSCIDCHMPGKEGADGGNFKSHHWTSPLKDLEASSCFACHTDEDPDSLIAMVENVQAPIAVKTDEVAAVILELIEELTKAVDTDSHSEEELDQARDLHRKAQFKWDFVFVENGEGFHNSALANKNLDEARELAEKGLSILK